MRTRPPWSALADIRWQYDYFDLVGVGGRIIRRPLVPVSIGRVGCERRTEVTFGLIDSGAEFTLADWGLADELELDPTTSEDEIVRIAVGGRVTMSTWHRWSSHSSNHQSSVRTDNV